MSLSKAADLRVSAELAKCASDPAHYIFTHIRTVDPLDTDNPVKRFPDLDYLRYVLDEILHGGESIEYVIKSRQIMMSWICVAYISWICRFHPYANCFIQSKKEGDAMDMLYRHDPKRGRLNQIEKNLPSWLRNQFVMQRNPMVWGTGDINFASNAGTYPNGSVCLALAQGPSQIEGYVPTFFLGDECSLQQLWKDTMAAVRPTLQRGKSAKLVCIATSRPPSDFNTEMEVSSTLDDAGRNIPTKDAWVTVNKGLYEYRSRSGIHAHGVHYSADPAKDPDTEQGKLWLKDQLVGYDGGIESPEWRQHMEMDFEATTGERPFAQILIDYGAYIIVPPMDPSRMTGWSFYSGFDYGKRNYTAWHIFGVEPSGRRRIILGLEGRGQDLGGHVGIARRMLAHPLFEKVNGQIDADPTLWNKNQSKTEGGYTSIAKLLADKGIRLRPAKLKGQEADEVLIERVRYEYWAEPSEPKLLIEQNCRVLIRQWKKLRYQEWSSGTQDEHGLKEVLVDRDNDCMDSCKYAESRRANTMSYKPVAPVGSFDWEIAQLRRKARRSRLSSGRI